MFKFAGSAVRGLWRLRDDEMHDSVKIWFTEAGYALTPPLLRHFCID